MRKKIVKLLVSQARCFCYVLFQCFFCFHWRNVDAGGMMPEILIYLNLLNQVLLKGAVGALALSATHPPTEKTSEHGIPSYFKVKIIKRPINRVDVAINEIKGQNNQSCHSRVYGSAPLSGLYKYVNAYK